MEGLPASDIKRYASARFWQGETDIIKEIAWLTGAAATGLNFKAVEGGWLLVIKAYSHSRQGGVVAFFGGHDPEDCLATLMQTATTKPGVQWKEDLYFRPG